MDITIYDFINNLTDTYCCRFSVYDINSEDFEYIVDNEYEDAIYENNLEDIEIESMDISTTKSDGMVHICFNVDL